MTRRPTPTEAIDTVCELANARIDRLLARDEDGSPIHGKDYFYCDIRAACCKALRELCGLSYPEIANYMRLRSHSSAIRACKLTKPYPVELAEKAIARWK